MNFILPDPSSPDPSMYGDPPSLDSSMTGDPQSSGSLDDGMVGLDPDLSDPDFEFDNQEFLTNWCQDLTDFPIVPPDMSTPGLRQDMGQHDAEFDFFRLFMTDTLLENLVAETNRYARETCAAKQLANPDLSHRSLFSTWKVVTIEEMCKFLSIIFHMPLVDKPSISDYWVRKGPMEATFAKKLMVRDRFKQIMSFFHLNNNATWIPRGEDGHDPLHKVRPLYDHMVDVSMITITLS